MPENNNVLPRVTPDFATNTLGWTPPTKQIVSDKAPVPAEDRNSKPAPRPETE